MSKNRNRNQPQQETKMDAPNVVDPIDQAFTNAMQAQPEPEPLPEITVTVTAPEAQPDPAVTTEPSPTAKQMAEAEELNAARLRQQAEIMQRQAEPTPEEPTLIGLAAQGMDVLHEALRKHSNLPTHPDYVPPPRTARQMEALNEELEAGRKAQQRAQQQANIAAHARAMQAAEERAKEGFTTPVHRPGDVVPNPMGGNGTFTPR